MAKSTPYIINEIKKRVKSVKPYEYSKWRIGITNSPAIRKQQWKDKGHDVSYWTQWLTGGKYYAELIESFYLNDYPRYAKDRMNGGTGGNIDVSKNCYVYIY